jgi:hypothetical protein
VAAVRHLAEVARKSLGSLSESTFDRLEQTLRAAAATSKGRDLLREGRLTEDLEAPGFEAFAGIRRSANRGKGPKERGHRTGQRKRDQTLLRRKEEAQAQANQEQAEADGLERHARDAEGAAKEARRLANSARERADRAQARVRKIDDELHELRQAD